MTGFIDRIRSASIGGQVTSVGGTPDSRIAAERAPAPQSGGPVPQGSGPRLSRALLKLLGQAKIEPPRAGQVLSVAEVDAALAAARMEVSDRMTVKNALSDLGLLV